MKSCRSGTKTNKLVNKSFKQPRDSNSFLGEEATNLKKSKLKPSKETNQKSASKTKHLGAANLRIRNMV